MGGATPIFDSYWWAISAELDEDICYGWSKPKILDYCLYRVSESEPFSPSNSGSKIEEIQISK